MQAGAPNDSSSPLEINLHGLDTYLYKYLLPLSFIPGDGFRSILVAFPPSSPETRPGLYFFLACWAVLTPVAFWHAFKVKRVFLSGDWLIVKGFIYEVAIPLADVEEIKNAKWPFPGAILKLKQPTEFGNHIRFIPKRIFRSETRGSLTELRARISQAKSKQLVSY